MLRIAGRTQHRVRDTGLYRASLRANGELLNGINLICPVQSRLQKYSASPLTQITSISLAIPSHTEGRFAIVTDVGRDAVDAGGALDEQR